MNRRAAALWLAATLFIVYGGTIPFDLTFDRSAAIAKLARLPLDPLISPDTGRRISIPDTIQNLLLFVPFGAFGFIALGGAIRSAWARAAAVTGLGVALSAGVETLQLFEPDRTTSVADVLNNTLGAPRARRPRTRRAGSGGNRRAIAAARPGRRAGVLPVSGRGPGGAGRGMAAVRLPSRCQHPRPQAARPPRRSVAVHRRHRRGCRVSALRDLALCGSLWLRQVGVERSAMVGAIVGGGAAIALEASQWIVGSRMPGLADAAVHAAGAVTGAWLARRWPWGRSAAFWCAVLGAATAAAAAAQMLSPFDWPRSGGR